MSGLLIIVMFGLSM